MWDTGKIQVVFNFKKHNAVTILTVVQILYANINELKNTTLKYFI